LVKSQKLLENFDPSYKIKNFQSDKLLESLEISKGKIEDIYKTPDRRDRLNSRSDYERIGNELLATSNLLCDSEKRRYPNILHLLERPSIMRTRRKRRMTSAFDGETKNTFEDSIDNLANLGKSSISKKHSTPARRKRLRTTSHKRKKSTEDEITYGPVNYVTGNPEYTPFFSTLNSQWPGSDKNLDLNVFTKGFTMQGNKIDPQQTFKMSPLKKSRYSSLAPTLGDNAKLIKCRTIEKNSKSSSENLSLAQQKKVKSSRAC